MKRRQQSKPGNLKRSRAHPWIDDPRNPYYRHAGPVELLLRGEGPHDVIEQLSSGTVIAWTEDQVLAWRPIDRVTHLGPRPARSCGFALVASYP